MFHKYDPLTGKLAPKLSLKDIEDNPISIEDALQIAKELGQDLVMINNAKMAIISLCKQIETKNE
jgi:hypothetical protein